MLTSTPRRVARRRLFLRGTADNKGQLTVNMAAIEAVIAERGALGFNSDT